MSMLDGILGQIGANVDIKNLVAKLGLDPAQVEAAVKALGAAHTAPGDTVQTAAADTGLSPDTLRQIVGHIGGEGSLGRFAEMMKQDGAGGLLGGLSNMFGKS